MVDVLFLAHLIEATLVDTPFPQLPEFTALALGIAATESGCQCIPQRGGGPALGVFQIEEPTARDQHTYLAKTARFAPLLTTRCSLNGGPFNKTALMLDIPYQVLLVRSIFYTRDPLRIPGVLDIVEQSVRYKKHYNTPEGKGTEEKYRQDYAVYIAPYWPLRHAHTLSGVPRTAPSFTSN